ncbi:MAG: hypothetical protein Q9209_005304 [Squamulea sp. 1 TL-2023]
MANSQKDNIITLSQLSEHKTQQDLWIAVYGKVYSLASFAHDHPGGIDVLKDCAGTDGSETYEYAGHSANNMKTMQRFLVGSLAGYTVSPADVPGTPHDSAAKTNGSSSKNSALSGIFAVSLKTWTPLLLLVTVVGVFAGLYWSFSMAVITDGIGKWDIGLWLARYANSAAYAFLGGLLIASSLSCTGFAVLYSLFSKTLEHERDVFSYPAVIPRRAGSRI